MKWYDHELLSIALSTVGCCFLSWVLGVGYSKSRSFHIIIRILLLVLFFFVNLFFFELISSRRGDSSCIDIFR